MTTRTPRVLRWGDGFMLERGGHIGSFQLDEIDHRPAWTCSCDRLEGGCSDNDAEAIQQWRDHVTEALQRSA